MPQNQSIQIRKPQFLNISITQINKRLPTNHPKIGHFQGIFSSFSAIPEIYTESNYRVFVKENFLLFFFIPQTCNVQPNLLQTYALKLGQIYSSRNILPRFIGKSPSFGKSYSRGNILPRLIDKSPNFGKSYRTRNILPFLQN